MSLFAALERLLSGPEKADRDHPLALLVREQMPDATADTWRLMTAVTGLLACVAYADREFSDTEHEAMRTELARLPGMDAAGAGRVVGVLSGNIRALVANGDHGWVRDVRELTSREQRLEILDVLLDLAAADGVIDHSEVNYLRRLATQLGLEQQEYNAAQARHRDKLGLLD
ncbi:MAG: TerB family tellurite resistance protein [Deltaproteobacteria bacterium]|nr:TerB family tellurite resistance protein [Deltaproteobacteria bacterium]